MTEIVVLIRILFNDLLCTVSLLEVVETVCFVKFLRRLDQLEPVRVGLVSFVPVVFDHGVPQQ